MTSTKKMNPKDKKLIKLAVALLVALGLSSVNISNTAVGDAISNTINQFTNVLLYGNTTDTIVLAKDTTVYVSTVPNDAPIN